MQEHNVVVKVAKALVALSAEVASDLACLVTVVDMLSRLTTDSAVGIGCNKLSHFLYSKATPVSPAVLGLSGHLFRRVFPAAYCSSMFVIRWAAPSVVLLGEALAA